MSTIAPRPEVETSRVFGHVRPLDGLRAIAVVLVLAFHAGIPGFAGGRAGVDVFFVLSGFLITSLLLDEHRRTGAVRLAAFYMRRALRLYPALLVCVAGALTLGLLKMPVFHASAGALKDTLRGTPFALFYTMNIGRAMGWSSGGFLGHTWSLAIEEQFYLVWPVVVILVLRRRTGPERLGWIALSCAIGSAALRAGLNAAGFNADMLYNATFSHVDGIFAGCAFAVLWSQRPDVARRIAHPALTVAGVGIGAAVVMWGQQMNTVGYLLVVAATVVVLAAVLTRPASRLSAGLSHPAAVAIGRRSYGIYLYHWPIFLFLGVDTRPHILVMSFALSFAAAWVSFAVVEQPFLAMKRRWASAPATGPDENQPSREGPRISLLHATYKRLGGPLEVRDAWISRAADPASIEYVVSMDADDLRTVALTEGIPRHVNPAGDGQVTAVRNWNAAAAAAQGDLLVVIADDLFPPPGWDRDLLQMIGRLDPNRTPFVVKLADAPWPGDILLRHPVISRAYYRKFGLFSPSYRGVYCDNDFTARAYWRSVILDGRSLQLEHRHPDLTDAVAPSESHDRLNRRDEYQRGEEQYLAAWSKWQRTAKRRFVPTSPSRRLGHWDLLVTQRRLRASSKIHYVVRGLWINARLLSRRVVGRTASPTP